MWKTVEIPELNISFEIYDQWPILNWTSSEVKGFYQPIANSTGVQFIQFGKTLTLNAYMEQLGDSLNQVIRLKENEVLYNNEVAREMQMYMFIAKDRVKSPRQFNRLRKERKLESLLEFEAIEVVQFEIPIIIGYRIPVSYKDQYAEILEHFKLGIRPMRLPN